MSVHRHILFVLSILVHCVGTAGAQTYWAVDAGAVLVRADGSITTVQPSGDALNHTVTTGSCTEWRQYVISADGDVGLAAVSDFCLGQIDPDGYSLEPPLTLVDLPLAAGKTWSQLTTLHPMYGSQEWTVFVEATVLGPTRATVPAGIFDVVAVQVQIISFSWQMPSETRTLLLQANLGDVSGLVSWQGVVPDAAATWGGVKALFR